MGICFMVDSCQVRRVGDKLDQGTYVVAVKLSFVTKIKVTTLIMFQALIPLLMFAFHPFYSKGKVQAK